MTRLGILLAGLLLAGCVNLDLRPALVDPHVKPTLEGEDCAYQILLPILIGSLSAERAMQNAGYDAPSRQNPRSESRMTPATEFIPTPITKVHNIEIRQRAFLFFGATCIHVTGE
jgi:hypothetical protein